MIINCFTHVSFEGPGYIADWAKKNNHTMKFTQLYDEKHVLPNLSEFDMLLIMGGPMGVYDNDKYPWLDEELRFIQQAVEENKLVLGICLGAQLIARALGAKVYKGKHEEIGWFPLELTKEGKESNLFNSLYASNAVFHWHGDTFDLPPGAQNIAYSEATPHQGFVYGNNVLALQFHLEGTEQSLQGMLTAIPLRKQPDKPYVQDSESVRAGFNHIPHNNRFMEKLLDAFTSGVRFKE